MMTTSTYRKAGGHESVINCLTTQLQKMGYDMSVGAFHFESEPPENVQKIRLSRIGILVDRSPFNDKDIIHSHQTLMNYYAFVTDKPFIFHYHGISNEIQKYNMKLCFAILRDRIAKTISVSPSANKDLQIIVGKIQSEIIYNGVDTSIFKPNKDCRYRKGDPQLLFVGNLFHYKNILMLIKSIPELLRRYPRLHLAIIGSGGQYNEILTFVHQKGLSNNIQLLGQIPNHDLPPYYSSCDVYVSASLKETFNLPAMEAMASGKPIAVSNIPSHTELVSDSRAGCLFSPLHIRSIIDCIDHVYQDRVHLGKAATEFAKLHDWSNVADRVSKIYDMVISK